MIAIINYGMGNIYSIQHAIRYLGAEAECTGDFIKIRSAEKIILPGVGSYYRAMEVLSSSGLKDVITSSVKDAGIPILGICLGMQLLGNSSDEDGFSEGLGFFREDVRVFSFSEPKIKIPHVGFNSVKKPERTVLFRDLPEHSDFYFTHSHRMTEQNETRASNGICCYGNEPFIASFEKKHVFGVQFHPEKSQNHGLRLLKNFIEYT